MKVIMVATPKGGAGKTTVAEIIVAGCEIGGLRTFVFDADAGNHGYIRRCGKGSAKELGWNADHAAVAYFIDEHLKGVDVLVIDFGANLLASGTSILEYLAALLEQLRANGATVLTAAIASPNAPGTESLMKEMSDKFGTIGETVLVENNTDGSGAFPPMLFPHAGLRASLQQIPSGIVAARLKSVKPLRDVLLTPVGGYTRAAAMYARSAVFLLAQPPFHEVVGPAVIERLLEVADGAPASLYYEVKTDAQSHDEVITLNETLAEAGRALDSCVEQSAWQAICGFRDAKSRYHSRCRQK
jgi:hypothetical protein